MNSQPKPRLLFVIHSLVIGGTENLVFQMSCHLKDRFEIGICCLDKQGLLWEKCEQEGFSLYNLQRKPGLRLDVALALKNVFTDFKPDVIHAHQYTPFLYSSMAKILARSKANFVFTEHGRHFPDLVSAKRRLFNSLVRILPDAVTGVCKFTRDRLVENEGFKSESIEVIYNGIPLNEELVTLDIRDRLGLSPDQKTIGVVGSLRSVKNPLFVLRGFSRISQEFPEAVLVYIGDGELRDEVGSLAHELGIERKVKLAGNIIPATPYLSSLDCFVMGSLSEACSLALLEAMFAEVPAIVSDRGGSPELVIDGEHGQVVACDDDEQLAQAIRKVLLEESSVEDMVKLAKERVRNEFSFAEMCSKYEAIYGRSA